MQFKDTLSQEFKTLNKDQVIKIYSCGPTVYDYPHIGNWYAFLRWDLLVRILQSHGYKTLWIMNITDVGHLVSDADEGEDKLVQQAQQQRKTAYEIAQFYGDYFLKALERLNFNLPHHLPKASEHITEQIDLIKSLEALELTYMIDDGLYYDTARCPNYGQLAKIQLSEKSQARIKSNSQKRNLSDFALWKLSPQDHQRDMEWDSPWGRGFPGWHLECSAMAYKYLGASLDIHTGGIDHIPIHHTNEIAQSEMGYGEILAKIWLHSNFVLVDGRKMSKSLNNFYTLEDIEKQGYNWASLRLAVFSFRYHNLANFTWETLKHAQKRLHSYETLASRLWQWQPSSNIKQDLIEGTLKQIKEALADDLNSPLALEILDSLCQKLNLISLSADLQPILANFISEIDQLLGLKLSQITDLTGAEKEIVQQREQAREQGNWLKADTLRKTLSQSQINILDTDFGPLWAKYS